MVIHISGNKKFLEFKPKNLLCVSGDWPESTTLPIFSNDSSSKLAITLPRLHVMLFSNIIYSEHSILANLLLNMVFQKKK